MVEKIKLVHVGSLLKDGYMEPSGMSLKELADKIDSTPASLSRLLSGKATLSYDMAIKLEGVFGRKAYTWLTHQVRYELQQRGIDC